MAYVQAEMLEWEMTGGQSLLDRAYTQQSWACLEAGGVNKLYIINSYIV